MASTVVVPRVTNSIPNPVNDPAVIAPALANAALLVAAPSLGCLRTYISILTDLHQANGLPVPDLELVHGNVDFQFYRQYHAHTDATVPDNEGEIDPFPCVVTPIEGARPELAHDTPNESELMGTSTTSSDVVNSSVCDSPKVNKEDLLVKLGTASKPKSSTSTPTSSTATQVMLNSSYIFTPTSKKDNQFTEKVAETN
ncbi:unnamed protein product [Meganyctiphanes norvegica]|uniref:Uncharacterized protein n=1 Tax=Meganyctiphanes norvegica TaxID=48144 RepID=A0AAV2SSP5_MEGNR